MTYGSCRKCVHYNECYPRMRGEDDARSALRQNFNAVTKRDLCVNNDKVDWEQASSKSQ